MSEGATQRSDFSGSIAYRGADCSKRLRVDRFSISNCSSGNCIIIRKPSADIRKPNADRFHPLQKTVRLRQLTLQSRAADGAAIVPVWLAL